MEIGKELRIVKVSPEPYPMGQPREAPKEQPVPEREKVLVPA